MSPSSPPGVQSTLMGGHTSDAWRSRPGSRAPPSAAPTPPPSWPTGAPCPTPRCCPTPMPAPAVVADGRTVSYAALLHDADAAARRLHAHGARAGDRVGIALPPGAAFAVAL